MVGQYSSSGPQINYLAFIRLFHWKAWLGILSFAIGITTFLTCRGIHRISFPSQSLFKFNNPLFSFKVKLHSKGSDSSPSMIVFLMLLQLGNYSSHLPNSMRVTYFTAGIACFLIFGFYTALLTSHMTFSDMPKKITQLEDILTMDYNLHVGDGSGASDRFIKASNYDTYRVLTRYCYPPIKITFFGRFFNLRGLVISYAMLRCFWRIFWYKKRQQ